MRETREGLIAPVFFGSALNGFGVRRLLKALRHDTPDAEAAAARLGADGDCAYAFKTAWAGQAGKLVYVRVLSGRINDGAELTLPNGEKARASGLFQILGSPTRKISLAERGEMVALGKVEAARAGDLLSGDGKARKAKLPLERRTPVYTLAIATADRKDDVRLSGALTKLLEEDPALVLDHDQATHATLLGGQGDTHLKVALERLKRRYGVDVRGERPTAAYRETIRKTTTQRGRHKKQTGGHGQFGDVVLEVGPRERGSGFVFSDRISGGVVPKQWIPAVEDGVRDAMERGPLGFPVVDVEVVLTDGSYHCGGQLRARLPHRRADRHDRRAEGLRRLPAGADRQGDHPRPVLGDVADHLGDLQPPGPDPGLRHPRRLARLGPDRGLSAGGGAARPDRGAEVGDAGARRLRSGLLAHGRGRRPPRRRDRPEGALRGLGARPSDS